MEENTWCVTFVFCFDAGDTDREAGFESDINRPAADGGSLGVEDLDGTFELLADPVIGACSGAGVGSRARVFAVDMSFRGFGLLAM